MDNAQFIFSTTGTITVNYDYTVTLTTGTALQIDWFAGVDLVIDTPTARHVFNSHNLTPNAAGQYVIKLPTTTDLHDLPVRWYHPPVLVAGNVVIDTAARTYFVADQLDVLPDEVVATHGPHATRITVQNGRVTTAHYQQNG